MKKNMMVTKTGYAVVFLFAVSCLVMSSPGLAAVTDMVLSLKSDVMTIAIDDNGSRWIGTAGDGLVKMDGDGLVFLTKDDGLKSNHIRSLAFGNDGTVWTGTWGGGVAAWDGTSFTVYTKKEGVGHNSVWEVALDQSGNVWAGTWGGVSVFDGSGWTTYGKKEGLAHPWVQAIAFDAAGRGWFGTPAGLCLLDNGSWSTFTVADGLADNDIKDILVDAGGIVWIATWNGVVRYDGSTFTAYGQADGLQHTNIVSLTMDGGGTLWAAAVNGGGIYRFDGTRWHPAGLNGSGDRDVRALAVDAAGRIWAATDNQVAVVDSLPPAAELPAVPETSTPACVPEVNAAFAVDGLTVTAVSSKDLSNVVLAFCDGTHQKFDGLSGLSAVFSGTGDHTGKGITGVWIKSGCNASGDGPGYGVYVANAAPVCQAPAVVPETTAAVPETTAAVLPADPAPMPEPGTKFATGTVDGKIYVVGGTDGPGLSDTRADLLEYDPAANTWTEKTPMDTPRKGPGASAVDGDLFVVGGQDDAGNILGDVAAYDPQTDTWSAKAPLGTPRAYAGQTVLGGMIYVTGGMSAADPALCGTEVYDPVRDEWNEAAALNTGRRYHVTVTVNEKIYVIGGISGQGILNSIEVYDPVRDVWTYGAPKPTPCWGAATVVLNKKIYVIGGMTAGSRVSTDIEVYDPVTDTWSVAGSLPEPRFCGGAEVVGEEIVVIGGATDPVCTPETIVPDMIAYDPPACTTCERPEEPVTDTVATVVPADTAETVVVPVDTVLPEPVVTVETLITTWDTTYVYDTVYSVPPVVETVAVPEPDTAAPETCVTSDCARIVITITEITFVAGVAGPPASPSHGVAWLDFDGDGDQDLFVSNHPAPCIMYRNNGDRTFTDVTAATGIGTPAISAAAGDFDNDGDADLYVADPTGGNKLYRNNGSGFFTEISAAAGVAVSAYSRGVAAADYDNDGYLDLFVSRGYPERARGARNLLFHNDGNGTFTPAAVMPDHLNNACSYGAVFADINKDGYQDLFVANGLNAPDNLFLNNGDGTFADIAAAAGVGRNGSSSGASLADYDRDGLTDIFVTAADGRDALYRNNGNGTFTDMTVSSGIILDGASTGSAFSDVNNDGFMDIFVSAAGGESRLYRNLQDGTFEDITELSGIDVADKDALGTAFGDFDGDGDQDLYICTGARQSNVMYMNIGKINSWLDIRLTGTAANRDGIGARVTVVAGTGRSVQERATATGMYGQNTGVLHFGLDQAAAADSVIIEWPSGLRQVITGVPGNLVLDVTEGIMPDLPGLAGIMAEPAPAAAEPDGSRVVIPVTGEKRVEIGLPGNGKPVTLTIASLHGKTVHYRTGLTGSSSTWFCGTLPAGCYVVTVDDGVRITTGRILVR